MYDKVLLLEKLNQKVVDLAFRGNDSTWTPNVGKLGMIRSI